MCTSKFKQSWIRVLDYDAKSVSWFFTSTLLITDQLDLAFGFGGIWVWEHGWISANQFLPLWDGGNNAIHDRSLVSYLPLHLVCGNTLLSNICTTRSVKKYASNRAISPFLYSPCSNPFDTWGSGRSNQLSKVTRRNWELRVRLRASDS